MGTEKEHVAGRAGGLRTVIAVALVIAVMAFSISLSDGGDGYENEQALSAPGDYNAGDIAVINNIISNNGLGWTSASPADGSYVPADWWGVTWSSDVTNKRISGLDFDSYYLTGSLDLRGLTALEDLNCYYNNLTSLDLSGLTALEKLNCARNNLTSLDLSGLAALKELDCSYNYDLASLDLSVQTALEELKCSNCGLSSLDLSGQTGLTLLECSNNSLTSLNVLGQAGLEELGCTFNSITSLNLTGLTALTKVNCSHNSITSLNLTGLTVLIRLECYDNSMTSLNLAGLTTLEYLNCSYNSLTSLNLTGLTAMNRLLCTNNELTSLTLTGLTNLLQLVCDNNHLASLNLSGLTGLRFLSCSYNDLTSLDISDMSSYGSLDVRYNLIPSISDITSSTIIVWDTGTYLFTPQRIYFVTYDMNGGSGTAPTETRKAVNQTFTAKSNTGITAPAGTAFKCWNTEQDGSGASYVPGSVIRMPDANLDLYAIWENILYTVTYNANGGTGTVPSESDKAANATFAAASSVSITAPLGKQFREWNTSANGIGASYAPGATVMMPAANLTLYAVWDDVLYTVTYDLNSGTGTVPSEPNKAANATFAAASGTGIAGPSGRVFRYWNTMINGMGASYVPGSAVTMPAANLTLYAIWDDTIYTVTYSSNGGTGAVPSEPAKAANTTFAAASGTGMSAPSGRQFRNWNTMADGTGASYVPGATVTMPAANLVLYAIWEDMLYTVTYNANGGTGTVPSEANKTPNATFAAASGAGLTAPSEKQFRSWNTMADGTGASYVPGSVILMPAANITLYAIWEDISDATESAEDELDIKFIIMIVAIVVTAAIATAALISSRRNSAVNRQQKKGKEDL